MSKEPECFRQAFSLYSQGDYEQAFSSLSSATEIPAGWLGRWYEIRMDLAARCGWLDLAEDILEAALDLGYFFNEFVLRRDDDVMELQGRPRFEILVERSFNALKEAQSQSQPQLKILVPVPFTSVLHPTMFFLHGNNHTAEEYLEEWKPLTRENWLVAMPQSSELSGKNQYVWNDFNRVDVEISQHYQSVCKAYQIDPQRTIVSGFSKGGHAAIYSTLKGFIPARGFIALAAYVGDAAWLAPLLENPDNKKLRGYFILGGKDQVCTSGALKLVEKLRTYSIACEVEMFPEMGHAIPDPLIEVVDRAIQFILNE